jgi:hypothetical protein
MPAEIQVILLAIGLLVVGGLLLLPLAEKGILTVPRHKIAGIILTTLAMAWTCWTLYIHPVDFLAFLTPMKLLLIGIIVTPLICIYLDNLLCARAIGGILMLWPMPIILATRDFVTMWRLIPITIGYLSLTFGMVAVFHPWSVRILCERLSEYRVFRLTFAMVLIFAGILCLLATCSFGKVVGQ